MSLLGKKKKREVLFLFFFLSLVSLTPVCCVISAGRPALQSKQASLKMKLGISPFNLSRLTAYYKDSTFLRY